MPGGGPASAQPGGYWFAIAPTSGLVYDAIAINGVTVAVGSQLNYQGGADAAVFTNFALSMQHDCGTAFCILETISNDGLWGGLQFDSQVGLLNLTTNQRYLLLGDAQACGVLGGVNPVLFYESATGPRAMDPGGSRR